MIDYNTEKAVEIFGKAILGEDTFSNLSDTILKQVYQNVIKAEFTGTGFPPLEESKIREIRLPTLLIQGDSSRNIFKLLINRLEQLIPNTRKKVIQGASHVSHEDNPLEFDKAVLSYIEEHLRHL